MICVSNSLFSWDFDDESGYLVSQWKQLIWDQVLAFKEPDFSKAPWEEEEANQEQAQQ